MTVRIADLGEWGRRPILAEYEHGRDLISVNARIVERLRVKRGSSFAARFIAYAVWHELEHRRSGHRDEFRAHAVAKEQTGDERLTFEEAIKEVFP